MFRRNLFGVFLAPLAMKAVYVESAASFSSLRSELLQREYGLPDTSRSVIKYQKTLQVPEIIEDAKEIKSESEGFGVTYIVDRGNLMPTYLYRCDNESCRQEFETVRSIKADYLVKCPTCNKDTLNVVIHAAHTFIRGEAKTVGMLADRNTDAMTNAHKSELYAKQEHDRVVAKQRAREELEPKLPKGASLPKYETSDMGPVDMSLSNLSPGQQKKYIKEGVKP